MVLGDKTAVQYIVCLAWDDKSLCSMFQAVCTEGEGEK